MEDESPRTVGARRLSERFRCDFKTGLRMYDEYRAIMLLRDKLSSQQRFDEQAHQIGGPTDDEIDRQAEAERIRLMEARWRCSVNV